MTPWAYQVIEAMQGMLVEVGKTGMQSLPKRLLVERVESGD